jgi:AcrR family transcriptional regulator
MSSSESPKRSTRELVLDAALALFTEEGATDVRLEDIAKRAGVSRQSVYVHFGSRAGLLLALVQHVDATGLLEALMQRIFEAPTSPEALDAIVHLHAEYSPAVYPVARVFMLGRHEDEALRVAWDDRMEARRNVYRFVIEWLQRDGLLAPPWSIEVATDVVFVLTSWQGWELFVIDQRWSKEAYLEHLRVVLRRTLIDEEG